MSIGIQRLKDAWTGIGGQNSITEIPGVSVDMLVKMIKIRWQQEE